MFVLRFSFLIISIIADENLYIHEELPANTLLYSMTKSTNILQWLPSSYIYQSYFFLSRNQSLYTTNHSIDREKFCEKKFCNCSQCIIELNFLETFTMNNISIRTIRIFIEDINDHSPTFKQSIIKLSIAENVPIDYEIPLESAIDYDYGLYSIQNYELYPLINNPFRLRKSSIKPCLQLKEILDREMRSVYRLRLIAFDGGKPTLSGEQLIEITITDINDNSPIFDQNSYRITLPENQPIDSLILKIHATDLDENENGRIAYMIDDLSVPFIIDSQTGNIQLKTTLDYEKIRSYSLTIKAHDHGMPQLTNYVTVQIDVTDVNDHTPNILLTQINGTLMNNRLFNLSECSGFNIPLLYIYITDEDSGENSRVNCILNDTRLNLIYLTTNAYSLQRTNQSIFDYEIEQLIIVHLQCSDFGLVPLSTSIFFHIQIDDCNDNPPSIISSLITNQTVSIPYETTQLPFLITEFTIDDPDRTQPKNFSFLLTFNPSLNVSLSINQSLILDSMPTKLGFYSINLTVMDIGNLSSSLIIPIHIYSLNETQQTSNNNKTTLILCLIFFIIIFLLTILISICFLLAFICQRKQQQQQLSKTNLTNSDEQINSSQKTTIEIIDESNNSSSNHLNYSEKVQRYLNDHYESQRSSIDSIQDSFKQLYILTEYQQDLSTFTSDSLYV